MTKAKWVFGFSEGNRRQYSKYVTFGTNDLTQMNLGYSRDDAEHKFLKHYAQAAIPGREEAKQ